MVGRSSGISVRKWMKPNCFARNMRVDYAPTGRAKCNLEPEGPFIAKGEPAAFYALGLSLTLSLTLPPTPTPALTPTPTLTLTRRAPLPATHAERV